MTKYKLYAAYKSSGVEWLGDVPKHWQLKRLKFVCNINPTKAEISHLANDTKVSFCPMELVGNGTISTETTKLIEEVRQGFTYFRDGDVVVAKITPSFENGKGAIASNLVNGLGFGTTELHVLRPSSSISRKFLYYLTASGVFREVGAAQMYGVAGQKRVPNEFLNDFPAPLPPIQEQKSIAHFLDCETTRIDTLITKKRELIKLLEKKRAAIVTEAVTKGRDRHVPLKDSSLEWFDGVEIPEHWRITRLKFLTSQITVGIVVTPAKYYVDSGIPCLRSLNVKEGKLLDTDLVFISSESNELHFKSMIFEGDVVIVRTGQPGSTAVVDKRFHGANCIDLIIVRKSYILDSHYLSYLASSDFSKIQFELGSDGAIQQHFNVSTAANLQVLVPPLDEQKSIVSFLDQKLFQFDKLTRQIDESVKELEKYRQALITAAVTGKIDVREEVESDRGVA